MGQFQLNSLTEYTDEAILDELRRIAALNGSGQLSRETFRKLSSKVSQSTISRRFGGWKKALEAAGLAHLYVGMFFSPREEKLKRGRKLSNDELIAEMQRVHTALGSIVLTAEAFDKSSITHSDVIRERYRNWKTALDVAKIGQSDLGKRYTDEQCFENLANVWTHYGRTPRYWEIKLSPSIVGAKAYVLRWGTWRKALKAFIEWANTDSQASPQPEIVVVPMKLERSASTKKEEDCREIRPGLRVKLFMRDRFRCVFCGRSPATHLELHDLHADHIISVYDGGKTTFENLQTLCPDCNLGKGRISIK